MMAENSVPFTKEMRVATREIHNLSDTLVNTKLALALYDNQVWAEGLLVFYEIFKFLEEHTAPEYLPVELHRTAEFERDLDFYLGTDWKASYQPRKEVCDYLKHLEQVKRKNADLLVAYVYHLYMGLLSGGQILQKRRNLSQRYNPFSAGRTTLGAALTTFEDGSSIYELKQRFRSIVNDFGERLDDETRRQMMEESKKVFELNNVLIRSVQGVGQANVRTLAYVLMIIVLLLALKYLLFR